MLFLLSGVVGIFIIFATIWLAEPHLVRLIRSNSTVEDERKEEVCSFPKCKRAATHVIVHKAATNSLFFAVAIPPIFVCKRHVKEARKKIEEQKEKTHILEPL